MEHRQLEHFVALIDEQQFTRAAERCRISQSGLSSSIRRLEAELGAPLFERTTRSVVPTPAGLALVPHARELIARASAARDAVVRSSHQLAGSLRVGAEQCLGAVDVNLLLERFHRRYPAVDIQFTQAGSHQLLGLVQDGELDVAFVAAAEVPSALVTHELGRRPVVLLCPDDHPLANRATVSLDELTDDDFVDFRPSWGVRTLTDAAFAAQGIERAVRCSVDDVHTLIDLVRRGLGIALVPQHVAFKPEAATLRAVELAAGEAPEWIVSAVLADARSLAPRLLAIAEGDGAPQPSDEIAA
ncbi:LysR family transcriptional regulator [Protaetiibacter larvae]|uniref:LysR family transcriptional regulator n=1 Tax=Protaetiibacter larvae TaxID=2592654 RepID=A0A5C1Y9A8_9MICO|nr:LysR family transcriptional regulator [Protaetiibacter larvae]QEO10673.1 LysR family transcriptional regulator [Protaetiibacter larvae]